MAENIPHITVQRIIFFNVATTATCWCECVTIDAAQVEAGDVLDCVVLCIAYARAAPSKQPHV